MGTKSAADSKIHAVHNALAQSPRNNPLHSETPTAPCVRLRTMERLIVQFREVAGVTSMLSFAEFKQAADIKTDSFANRLFKAIDADGNGFITCEEFVNFLYNLECQDMRGRLKVLFDLYDIDDSGKLGIYELQSILKESVCESNAKMEQGLIKFLAECLMDAFDKDLSGDISFEEFVMAMSQFPDVFSGLTIHGSGLTRRPKCSIKMGFWAYTRCLCRQYYSMVVNNRERTFSTIVLLILLAFAFWWRCSLYISGPKYDLMGWTLPVAKGFGQMMKVLFVLILFPISRNFMTWLRKTPLKYVFPVDDAIDYHKILGTLVFIFAWVHSLCHVNDIWRWGDPSRVEQWKMAFPEEESQPTRLQIVLSLVGITGILQLLIYTIVFFTASNWPRRTEWMKNTKIGRAMNDFNLIWFVHHLVFVGMALLIFHPMPHIPDEANEWGYSDSWVWIGIPLVVYLAERLVRWHRRSKSVQVLSAEILPGRVIAVKLSKPKNMICKTGMFIYINAPSVAKYEWHPFSLTSPSDACHLCVHIKVCGDWTEALYNQLSHCTGVLSRCHDGKELVTRLSAAGMGRRESLTRPNNAPTCSSLVWQPAVSPPIQNQREAKSPTSQILYNNMINPNFVALPESFTGKPKSPRPLNNQSSQESGSDGSFAFSQSTPRDALVPETVTMGEPHRSQQQTRRNDSFAVDLSHVPASPRPMLGVESPLSLKIDGPYGAPVQGFKEHSVLLLVGAGIGVTPFAGILSDLVYRIRQAGSESRKDSKGLIPGLPKLKKVYFYWSVRSQSEVVWFSRVLEAISKDDVFGILDINVHVTGLKDTKDVRTALLKIVQVSMHVSTGVDVMSGLRSRVLTHFGRPNWESVFQRIQDKYPKQTVGVFYSGPNTLASILRQLSQKHSNKGGRFKFVKEAFGYW